MIIITCLKFLFIIQGSSELTDSTESTELTDSTKSAELTDSTTQSDSAGLSGGGIAGIVIFMIILLVLGGVTVVLVLIIVWRKKVFKKSESSTYPVDRTTAGVGFGKAFKPIKIVTHMKRLNLATAWDF